jgi:hypothetical protein
VTFLKQCLAFSLVVSLIFATAPVGLAYPADQPSSTPVQAAQQTPEQLQQLVVLFRSQLLKANAHAEAWMG